MVSGKVAEALIAHFKKWFTDKTSSRRVFAPCVITRTPESRFELLLEEGRSDFAVGKAARAAICPQCRSQSVAHPAWYVVDP
jgi:hypothetical protein